MRGGAGDGSNKIHRPGSSGRGQGWGWGSVGGDTMRGREGWGCPQPRPWHPGLRDAEKRGEGWESGQRRNVEFSLRRKNGRQGGSGVSLPGRAGSEFNEHGSSKAVSAGGAGRSRRRDKAGFLCGSATGSAQPESPPPGGTSRLPGGAWPGGRLLRHLLELALVPLVQVPELRAQLLQLHLGAALAHGGPRRRRGWDRGQLRRFGSIARPSFSGSGASLGGQ